MARQRNARPQPEITFGPYPGGLGVAVWLNEVEGDDGPRRMRSITIAARRYRDPESGEWRDSTSYRPGDLPVLVFALQKAQEYVFTTPLPDEGSREPGDAASF